MGEKRIIYGLFDSDGTTLRYVGQTTNFRQRLRAHETGQTAVTEWIRGLWQRGDHYVAAVLLELVPGPAGECLVNMAALAVENKIINWHRKHYAVELLNDTISRSKHVPTSEWAGKCVVANDDIVNPPRSQRPKRKLLGWNGRKVKSPVA